MDRDNKFLNGSGLKTLVSKIKETFIDKNNDTISATTIDIENTPNKGSSNLVTSGGVYSALDGKVDKDNEKGLSTNDYTDEDKTKLDNIEAGANKTIIQNSTTSTATNEALSANMGKELQDEIDNLKARGRFLSLWNCKTGLPETNPLESPYKYQSGDYYIVNVCNQFSHNITINSTDKFPEYNLENISFSITNSYSTAQPTGHTVIFYLYENGHNSYNTALAVTRGTLTEQGVTYTVNAIYAESSWHQPDNFLYIIYDGGRKTLQITIDMLDQGYLEVTDITALLPNYKPTGTEYIKDVKSTEVETNTISINDMYYYDGIIWKLFHSAQKEISFSNIVGNPQDNTNLRYALNKKVTWNPNRYSVAVGLGATSTGDSSQALGQHTTASGTGAHAEGGYAVETGSPAERIGNKATGIGAHVEGYACYQNGQDIYNVASGAGAHAEGVGTKAESKASHAEGESTTASGGRSHAEGKGSEARGYASHAEGEANTLASGNGSHAEGINTKAYGHHSHVEGHGTIAGSESDSNSAQNAHAEGYLTKALHNNSHAAGVGTETGKENQTVVGQYNTAASDSLFVVGNGTASTRSNAFEVKSNGQVISGSEEVANDNKALATKKYVDTHNMLITGECVVGESSEPIDTLEVELTSPTEWSRISWKIYDSHALGTTAGKVMLYNDSQQSSQLVLGGNGSGFALYPNVVMYDKQGEIQFIPDTALIESIKKISFDIKDSGQTFYKDDYLKVWIEPRN